MAVSGISTLGAHEILDVFEELGAELERPALALRIRVAVRRRVLDKDLARGDSPLRSDVHALRARQLVERAAASAWQRHSSASLRAPREPHRQARSSGSRSARFSTRVRGFSA